MRLFSPPDQTGVELLMSVDSYETITRFCSCDSRAARVSIQDLLRGLRVALDTTTSLSAPPPNHFRGFESSTAESSEVLNVVAAITNLLFYDVPSNLLFQEDTKLLG